MSKSKKPEQGPAGRRAPGSRIERETFLILCEGEKTEVNYFKDFRDDLKARNVRIEIKGKGYNTLSLVEEAKNLNAEEPYDHVWCVFDDDGVDRDLLSQAFALAQQEGFKVAFSNECFELWYVLHLDDHQAAFTRHQLGKKLTTLLRKHFPAQYPSRPPRDRRSYGKSDKGLYGLLKDFQARAIQRAARLQGDSPYNAPSPNPSTSVHRLVEKLNSLRPTP